MNKDVRNSVPHLTYYRKVAMMVRKARNKYWTQGGVSYYISLNQPLTPYKIEDRYNWSYRYIEELAEAHRKNEISIETIYKYLVDERVLPSYSGCSTLFKGILAEKLDLNFSIFGSEGVEVTKHLELFKHYRSKKPKEHWILYTYSWNVNNQKLSSLQTVKFGVSNRVKDKGKPTVTFYRGRENLGEVYL